MDAMLMTKALVSISLLDIKEVQHSLLKNSFFDVQQYVTKIVAIIDVPKNDGTIVEINVER